MKLSIWRYLALILTFRKTENLFFYSFIAKLHMQPVGLEATTSPSTLLQREEVKFELIGTSNQW
jgi:hypothetical protein